MAARHRHRIVGSVAGSFFVAACFSGIAAAATGMVFTATEAPVTGVTLYPGSATVERSVRVAAGTGRIEVRGLPSNFDPATLRVQAEPGIRIGQIVHRDTGRSETPNPREAELEAQIQALQDQQATLDADAKAATLLQNYLEKFGGAAAVDKGQPYVDAKTMAGIVDTLRRNAGEVFGRQQRIQVQKRELDKKIHALQRDLERIRSGAKDVRDLTVNLAAERAGTLRIAYQVNGAGWQPAYRAALDSAASMVELERLATVKQKTGEDWSGVKLRLSTGQPRLSPQAPEPRPWLLNYHRPLPAGSGHAAALMAYAPAAAPASQATRRSRQKADEPKAMELDIAENAVAPVQETQGTFATEFEVPARVDLPADGREISVTLSKQNLPVRQRVRVTPRLNASAFVMAEAERPEGVWLPGSIQLIRDGSYVGATGWNPQATNRFSLPFGRDDLVQVKVDRTKGESGSAGVFNPQAERKVADLYTLTSHHKKPIDVLLLEASPVSTSEEVRVQSVFNPVPTAENWEQRQGIMAWEKSLAPGETLKFTTDYTITYPKEGSVTGLP